MNPKCRGCAGLLEADWVACPHCGRPVSGKVSNDQLVQIVVKLATGLVDVGLLQAEADAEKKGDHTRAAQLAVARTMTKELLPMLADAVTTYTFQHQALAGDSHGTTDPALGEVRRLGPGKSAA